MSRNLSLAAVLFLNIVSIRSVLSRIRRFQFIRNQYANLEQQAKLAALEAGLTHPITYDVYNLCDMSSKSKLKNLSISQLRDIYKSYDILTLMESQ